MNEDGDEATDRTDAVDDAEGIGDGAVDEAGIDEATLADGWRVWTEETEGRAILVYRPDVFDGGAFPAPCLPTLYLTNGSRRARPGSGQRTTDQWHVTLFLEPEVEAESHTLDDRSTAIDELRAVAERFATGNVDYRGAYQLPRDDYLDKLDALIRDE